MNVTLFVDASWCPESKVGGYGYWLASDRNKVAGGARLQTRTVNSANAAEMMGIVNALYECCRKQWINCGDRLLIQTDCKAAIEAFEAVRVLRDPQEQNVLNYYKDLTVKFGLVVKFKHVKGHTGHRDRRSITNDLCDKRAKKYMRLARNMKPLLEAKERLENASNHRQPIDQSHLRGAPSRTAVQQCNVVHDGK